MSEDLRLEMDARVARLTIHRPDKRNAMSLAMWAALPELVARAEAAPDVRLLVVRGAGGVFSGGADIEEFRTDYATEAAARANHAIMQRGMRALETSAKPSLAVLEGPCVGAGLGLALCCDLRLAAADARLAITPARLGLLYAHSDVRRLVEAVGWSTAKLMLYTARALSAEEALARGLVDEIAAPDALEAALARLEAELLAGAPFTQAGLKRLFTRLRQGQREESEETRALFAAGFSSADFEEGYRAFKEKRKPKF